MYNVQKQTKEDIQTMANRCNEKTALCKDEMKKSLEKFKVDVNDQQRHNKFIRDKMRERVLKEISHFEQVGTLYCILTRYFCSLDLDSLRKTVGKA